MFVKIHEAYRNILAVADSDLIGKTFEEGIRQIEVKESFFKGDQKTKEELLEIMQNFDANDATFNIVGNNAITTALEAGIIEKHGVMKIDNVPVALGLF